LQERADKRREEAIEEINRRAKRAGWAIYGLPSKAKEKPGANDAEGPGRKYQHPDDPTKVWCGHGSRQVVQRARKCLRRRDDLYSLWKANENMSLKVVGSMIVGTAVRSYATDVIFSRWDDSRHVVMHDNKGLLRVHV